MSSIYSHDHLGSVWYDSEPSEGPYSPKLFSDWSGTIFCYFLQQTGSKYKVYLIRPTEYKETRSEDCGQPRDYNLFS